MIHELVPLIGTILYSASWYALAIVSISIVVLAYKAIYEMTPSYRFGKLSPIIEDLIKMPTEAIAFKTVEAYGSAQTLREKHNDRVGKT